MLSFGVAEKCRHIDTVTVKGSSVPIELFTFDMDLNAVVPAGESPSPHKKDSRKKSELKRRKICKILTTTFATADMFESSRELQSIMMFHSP